jgi:hypothetical protein
MLCCAVLCCAVLCCARGIAEMGFNTWESWGCDISEEKVHAAADAMVAKGLKDVGCEERLSQRH